MKYLSIPTAAECQLCLKSGILTCTGLLLGSSSPLLCFCPWISNTLAYCHNFIVVLINGKTYSPPLLFCKTVSQLLFCFLICVCLCILLRIVQLSLPLPGTHPPRPLITTKFSLGTHIPNIFHSLGLQAISHRQLVRPATPVTGHIVKMPK